MHLCESDSIVLEKTEHAREEYSKCTSINGGYQFLY